MIRAYRPTRRATLADWLAAYAATWPEGAVMFLVPPAVLVAAMIGEVL